MLKPYITAYKQGKKPLAPWARHSSHNTLEEAIRAGEALQSKPYIVRVSVYTLEAWNYYKPQGDPLWSWERKEHTHERLPV